MRYQQCLMAAAFMSVLAPGCRKDKDSTPPSVSILTPGAGSLVSIPDTLAVGVAVSDDRQLESLTVMVGNVDGVPIAPSVTIDLSSGSANLVVELPLTDEWIVSGEYLITAVASDGANDARAFQSIMVNAAPLRVRSTLLVPPGNSPGPQVITRLDSTGNQSTFVTVAQLAHAVNGLDHLFIAGTTSAPLEKIRFSNSAVQSIMPNPGLWPSYFTCLMREPSDGRIYAGGADGVVRGFTNDGASALSGILPAGFHTEAISVTGSAVICAAVNPVSQQHRVFRLGYSSGVVFDEFIGPSSALSIFGLDGTRVLIFGNTAAGGAIHELSLIGGASVALREFPGDSIRCVEEFSEGRFSLGLSSGISRFDYLTTAVTTLLPGLVVDGLTWNPVNGAMLGAGGSAVTAFDPTTGVVVGTQSAPHAVSSVLLQLNR